MPSIEDRVDEIHPAKGNLTLDCTDAGTQPFKFDSQSSHSDILGKKFNEDFDELRFLQSTLPFYDTLPLEDPLQTQMMSLAGETQVLDDIDNIELMETQILDEFDDVVATDSQGSDKTEVLGETEECIDDYFMKREGVCPVDQESKLTEVLGETEEYFDDYFMNREGVGPMDQESKLCHALSKQDDGGFQAGSDGLINGQYSSALDLSTTRLSDKDTPETKPGSKQRNFTTVRVAALRASGLAAQGVSSKGAVNASHFLNSDSQSSKQYDAEDKNETDIQDSWVFEEGVDQEDFQREPNKTPNGNQGRIDGLTMRKLSIEEKLSKADAGADLDQLPACGYEMAGLSYVDSQEPGELSEADALHFVDKFLEANIMDFEQEVDIVRPVGGKSKSVSSTLGNQNLAKRTNLKRVYAQRGVFDWDDSREDEGGGEFLTKMKETFFDEGGQWQKSVTPSQKLRLTDCRASGVADETRDKEKRLDICTKAKRLFISNPRRLSKKARPNEKMNLKSQTKFRKDMPKKMDKLPEVGSSGVKAIGSMDLPKKIEVGFDTQIAAKAMEALCFGSAVAHCDDKDISQHIKNKHEVYRKIGEKNRAKSTKEYLQERPNSSNSRVLTRNQAKTIGTIKSEGLTVPSRKHAKNARATLNGHTSTNQIQNIDKAPSEVSKKIEVRAMRRKSLDHVDRCHAVASSSVNKSIKRSYMEDQVAIFAPIAHRTRQQRSANQERAGIESNYRDGIHQAEASKRRQRISSDVAFTKLSNEEKFLKSGSNQSSCLENTKSAEREKLQKKLTENNSHTSLAGENARSEVSPGDICRPSDLATATPANCTTPICSTSPVCKGDEYLKLSCRKNLSKEINGLISNMSEPTSPPKDSRKRKDLTIAQVLFSRHLDEDIIKQQKKILARLGASVALSMSEATHFITDKFVRTRNMLEAIACGKPVVTHLWLQSCERASCFIDERNYILRDTTKEKEFGFSLAVSLGRACQHPLLQGLRVFVTPNTKPSREILVSLVKATHGLAMERIGRSAFKEDKVPDDLLVLSCEEDYALCVPFLQKGAAVYSSELLLNGIVTQKLEYGRHRLFIDHVKRTRSTLWLKEDGNRYQPVKRLK